MSFTILWCLLLVKHLLLSQALDLGFSRSRDLNNPTWYYDFGMACLLEAVVTLLVLHSQSFILLSVVILGELLVLSIATWFDRHPKTGHELKIHVMCEFGLAISYGVLSLIASGYKR